MNNFQGLENTKEDSLPPAAPAVAHCAMARQARGSQRGSEGDFERWAM